MAALQGVPGDPSAAPARSGSWIRRNGPLLALALFAFLAALGVRHWLVPFGTGDADEGVYAYQAALLRNGSVTLPAATHEPFFRPWLTGEQDGRLFFQYEPGWPGVLAASDAVFGTKSIGVALSAAGLVLAVHTLALDLFASRRTALVAAALTALSPLFLFHSALYLAYVFTTMLATATLACAVRGARRVSLGWAVATGAGLGAMLLCRPFDGVLTGVAVVLIALTLGPRRQPARLLRLAMAACIAGLPFVAVALAYNLRTTGSLTTFPLSASDPRNTFGFGPRGMQVGTPGIHYELDEARTALNDNLRGVASWVFGGFVTIGLAAWAATWRDRRRERVLLVVFLALFPVGYFFWWATALSAETVTNGIGPHYYVPSFVPLVILAGEGFARLSRRHSMLAATTALVAMAVTAYNLPDKLDSVRYVTDVYTELDQALPADLDRALVFVASDTVEYTTTLRYPFLLNAPDLDGPILYPADRHGENAVLVLQHPERQAYLAHQEVNAGDDMFDAHWTLTPIEAQSGGSVALQVQMQPPAGRSLEQLRAFAAVDDGPYRSLPLLGSASGTTDVEVTLTGAAPRGPGLRLQLPPGAHDVVVGLEETGGPDRWQRRYRAYVAPDGTVTVLHPGIGEHVVDFGSGPVVLKEDVSAVVADR